MDVRDAKNLAILIPTRDRPAILADTIARLRALGMDRLPLWVYDDASRDAAAVRAAVSGWAGAQVVRGDARRGQAAGRNALLRRCGTEFAALLDDDQYFLEMGRLGEWAAPGAEAPPAVTAFQSVNVGDRRLAIVSARETGDAASFMGGACGFHVPSVLSAGGYREGFVYGWEEPELAMRLWLRGFRIRFDKRVVVEHNHRMTPDAARDPREYDYLYARNIVLAHALNAPLAPGLCLGLLRAVRFARQPGRRRGAVARGLAAGLVEALRRPDERTPVPWRHFLQWRRYEKTCAAAG